jgi:hypothetical protein
MKTKINLMKKLLIGLFALLTTAINAQNPKYVAAMEQLVQQLDSSKSISELQSINNAFERVAVMNPAEWLPLYYQSFANIQLGMRQEQNNSKDEYYDKAEALISKADSVKPNNSEIYVLKALIMSMKISVDPSTRGQKYGMQASMLNTKAIDLDKNNPRAYYLRGQGLMYTPAQFGGGADKALPVLQEAMEKFRTFTPSSSIMPNWGKERAAEALERCKNQVENGK